MLTAFAPPLLADKQRVLSLSCCFSQCGYQAIRKALRGHFSGVYTFCEDEIGFATAMTVWSMFYRKKTISRPAGRVVEPINSFFARDVLQYHVLTAAKQLSAHAPNRPGAAFHGGRKHKPAALTV
jgi:hypothetical protein